ncbi:hypothetical protein E7744_03700 [Citricoccus sp. SGAir0253]|uniref:hypothetical protein n=1 Tax=Citricoccus sp. SGAir0253 TaxID=2567881 RepID=UPI0010CD082B|nr:hypothetical protein [Citricoccus sp. SGAir0253]QCU77419.1 hypothetical protein E7744_03700 [Citricoccus sp. SGAir0253]
MPEQNPHEAPQHRYARAAGRATRAFLDASRQDARDAAAATPPSTAPSGSRSTASSTARRDRDARAAGPGTGPQGGAEAGAGADRGSRAAAVGPSALLRTARWWWALVTVLFALLTASFVLAGTSQPVAEGPVLGPDGYLLRDPLAGRTGQYVLAGLTGVLALATGAGTVQLLRSRRGAAGLLTGIAVLVGVPLILRGHPLLVAIAVVLLTGAALLWLPPVRRRLR